MDSSWNYLFAFLLILHVLIGYSTSTEHNAKDCKQEGCTNHITDINSGIKKDVGYESRRRICSPNSNWLEKEESCRCSLDGFRVYCTSTDNQVNLRRTRSIHNDNRCNGDNYGHGSSCCVPNIHFYNCMCRNYPNFCNCFTNCCCNNNRRKTVQRSNSCCDNCCEGLCGSTPDWKCYCTHSHDTQSTVNVNGQLSGNDKSIDLNTLFDFCKKHATSKSSNNNEKSVDLSTVINFCKTHALKTGSSADPEKISINTLMEFCKMQIGKDQVNGHSCHNKPTNQQLNPTKQEQQQNRAQSAQQSQQQNVYRTYTTQNESTQKNQFYDQLKSNFNYVNPQTAESIKPNVDTQQNQYPQQKQYNEINRAGTMRRNIPTFNEFVSNYFANKMRPTAAMQQNQNPQQTQINGNDRAGTIKRKIPSFEEFVSSYYAGKIKPTAAIQQNQNLQQKETNWNNQASATRRHIPTFDELLAKHIAKRMQPTVAMQQNQTPQQKQVNENRHKVNEQKQVRQAHDMKGYIPSFDEILARHFLDKI